MVRRVIDINLDVGECDLPDEIDSRLFQLISSCSIACASHAGNSDVIRHCIRLAKHNGLRVGAHPSYPDREAFGRTSLTMNDSSFYESIQNQIELVQRIAQEEGVNLAYVKPHGALYNNIAQGSSEAVRFLDVLSKYNVPLMCLAESKVHELAVNRKINFIPEAFMDRAYERIDALVPRKFKEAVFTDAEKAFFQFESLAVQRKLKLVRGNIVSINADSLCVHGDNPSALEILLFINEKSKLLGIEIKKYGNG